MVTDGTFKLNNIDDDDDDDGREEEGEERLFVASVPFFASFLV